jgi:hypothetical protein
MRTKIKTWERESVAKYRKANKNLFEDYVLRPVLNYGLAH